METMVGTQMAKKELAMMIVTVLVTLMMTSPQRRMVPVLQPSKSKVHSHMYFLYLLWSTYLKDAEKVEKIWKRMKMAAHMAEP